jgi:hypothetical protein
VPATGCTLANYPRGYDPAGAAVATATDFSGIGDLPELQCTTPAGVGAYCDVNIYWHGVLLTLDGFWSYLPPVVHAVSPSAANHAGGATVTVFGSNFGPKESWACGAAQAAVEVVGRGGAACTRTQWVSDGQLVCVLPPLPKQMQPVDRGSHTVTVQVRKWFCPNYLRGS